MDAFQHVNNTVYLRWFESARIAYFAKLGLPMTPILARATCDYRKAVKFPDTITVRGRVTKVGTTSFTMRYEVQSEKLGLAAEGEGIVVLYDYTTSSKQPIDDALRSRIAALEENPDA
ncbi:MAG: acyl-CoA thioesterase [Myxococcaceae bacterium]|nr:acyl-CoA thioesterase [Myxococcaceae bacterium]